MTPLSELGKRTAKIVHHDRLQDFNSADLEFGDVLRKGSQEEIDAAFTKRDQTQERRLESSTLLHKNGLLRGN